MIDKQRVMQKIAFIKEQSSDIKHLVSTKDRSELINDKFLMKGLKYSLQTAIEAMIDLAFHIAAKKYKYAAADARDAFRILLKNEVINEDEFKKFSAMVGFRNRVVHLYHNVTDERVYDLATSELGDFEVFIDSISKSTGITESQ